MFPKIWHLWFIAKKKAGHCRISRIVNAHNFLSFNDHLLKLGFFI